MHDNFNRTGEQHGLQQHHWSSNSHAPKHVCLLGIGNQEPTSSMYQRKPGVPTFVESSRGTQVGPSAPGAGSISRPGPKTGPMPEPMHGGLTGGVTLPGPPTMPAGGPFGPQPSGFVTPVVAPAVPEWYNGSRYEQPVMKARSGPETGPQIGNTFSGAPSTNPFMHSGLSNREGARQRPSGFMPSGYMPGGRPVPGPGPGLGAGLGSGLGAGLGSGPGAGLGSGPAETSRAPLQDPFGGRRVTELVGHVGSREAAMEEEEAPLLEELGIIPRDILRRTLCVLTFRKVGDEMLDSMDMTGPVLILLGLGCSCLLLSGKVHFEYVYGLMTGGTFGVWALLNLMSRSKLLSIHRTISVLGYGLLPILLVSFLAPFTKLKPYVATAGVLWSTSTASRFVEEALDMQAQRYLAAYPIMLFYICFTFITVL